MPRTNLLVICGIIIFTPVTGHAQSTQDSIAILSAAVVSTQPKSFTGPLMVEVMAGEHRNEALSTALAAKIHATPAMRVSAVICDGGQPNRRCSVAHGGAFLQFKAPAISEDGAEAEVRVSMWLPEPKMKGRASTGASIYGETTLVLRRQGAQWTVVGRKDSLET